MAPGIINDGPEQVAANTQTLDLGVEARSTKPKAQSKIIGSVYDKSHRELVDRHVDQPRPLKVAVIGGGLSGILTGVLLPHKVPGLDLTIYEKNKDFVCSILHTLCSGW